MKYPIPFIILVILWFVGCIWFSFRKTNELEDVEKSAIAYSKKWGLPMVVTKETVMGRTHYYMYVKSFKRYSHGDVVKEINP